MAVASYAEAFVCSDNQAAVNMAVKLLKMPPERREAALPADHQDIWLFFLRCARHATARTHRLKWIPAHRDWTRLTGRDRVLAFFNSQVDLVAKDALAQRTRDPRYQALVDQWFHLSSAAYALAHFHLRVAWKFCDSDPQPARVMPTREQLCVTGPATFLRKVEVSDPRSERFSARPVASVAPVFRSASCGCRETTPLELLWLFIH